MHLHAGAATEDNSKATAKSATRKNTARLSDNFYISRVKSIRRQS
jgi:hypothetical protein